MQVCYFLALQEIGVSYRKCPFGTTLYSIFQTCLFYIVSFLAVTGGCTTRRRASRSAAENDNEERSDIENTYNHGTLLYSPSVNTNRVVPCLCSDDSLGIWSFLLHVMICICYSIRLMQLYLCIFSVNFTFGMKGILLSLKFLNNVEVCLKIMK